MTKRCNSACTAGRKWSLALPRGLQAQIARRHNWDRRTHVRCLLCRTVPALPGALHLDRNSSPTLADKLICVGAVRISIIIPVYNEESTIETLLAALKDYGADELLVADGGSEDRTVEIASRHARIVHAKLGRAIQMNAAANSASGDVLIFLHADARLGATALGVVREVMADTAIIGGNFDIRYEGKDWAAAAFTRINRWRRRCGVFYGDSGIFCRQSVFQSLGGFVCWPILEDYEFARRLRRAGRLAYLSEPIWVSDRRWRNNGLLPTMASWFIIQSLYYAGVPPKHLARLYRHIR